MTGLDLSPVVGGKHIEPYLERLDSSDDILFPPNNVSPSVGTYSPHANIALILSLPYLR